MSEHIEKQYRILSRRTDGSWQPTSTLLVRAATPGEALQQRSPAVDGTYMVQEYKGTKTWLLDYKRGPVVTIT